VFILCLWTLKYYSKWNNKCHLNKRILKNSNTVRELSPRPTQPSGARKHYSIHSSVLHSSVFVTINRLKMSLLYRDRTGEVPVLYTHCRRWRRMYGWRCRRDCARDSRSGRCPMTSLPVWVATRHVTSRRHLCTTWLAVAGGRLRDMTVPPWYPAAATKRQTWVACQQRIVAPLLQYTTIDLVRDANDTFSFERRDETETFESLFETRPRPKPFETKTETFLRCRKRYSLLSFWLQTATNYVVFCSFIT